MLKSILFFMQIYIFEKLFYFDNNNNNNNNNNNKKKKKKKKKKKFDHTTKSYMHKPVSVLEIETLKILWDVEVETDDLIPARRPDQVIINKKERTYRTVDFAVQTDHRIKVLRPC